MPVETFGLFLGQVVDKDSLQLAILGSLDSGKKAGLTWRIDLAEILFLLGWLVPKVLFPGADGHLEPVVFWWKWATVVG